MAKTATKKESSSTEVSGPTRPPMSRLGCLLVGLMLGIVLVAFGLFLWYMADIDRSPVAQKITNGQVIAPRELISSTLAYSSVEMFDTDGDGEWERVLYYKYDSAPGIPVYGMTVLDTNTCSPRGIDSYHLIRIETSDLTAHTRKLEEKDIPGVGDSREVVLWGIDSRRLRTHLYVFAWRDDSDPCAPASPGYLNLGTFKGDGGIELSGNRVRVKETILGDLERSKLARTSVYEPKDGYYSQWIGGPLREPVTSAIEFVYPPKPDQLGSHYPERAVLRFYLSIEDDIAVATELLDSSLAPAHIDGKYARDVAEPGQLSSMVDVWNIDYKPDVEVEKQHGRVEMKVQVKNRRPDGTAGDPHHYRVWVQGFANDDALPYYCEWRIVGFEPVD